LPGWLRPGLCGWRIRAIQHLQIGAAVFTESSARYILPGAIRTGDQMIASCIGQGSVPNRRILNRS
jgi:hypothetical protein